MHLPRATIPADYDVTVKFGELGYSPRSLNMCLSWRTGHAATTGNASDAATGMVSKGGTLGQNI